MYRNKVSWSPLEEEYLKKHRDNISLNQLTITLNKSRNAIARKLSEFDGKSLPGKKNKKSIIGKRKDLDGQFCRSSWESNFCRYLKEKGIFYHYEPNTFVFTGIKRGTLSYLPDLYIPSTDEYIEIKGQLTPQGKTAIRRFKKFYPDEFKKLRAVVERKGTAADKFFKSLGVPIIHFYSELDKKYRNVIPHWE
jgi:hypothetical protein